MYYGARKPDCITESKSYIFGTSRPYGGSPPIFCDVTLSHDPPVDNAEPDCLVYPYKQPLFPRRTDAAKCSLVSCTLLATNPPEPSS